MNKAPKISVIVPVYRAEDYLERCVRSIICQTFQDWELILVDDGSPDNSGKICDKIANGHPTLNIKVIHKENGGVATAREAGIQDAQGVFSIHIDPDDWIEADTFELMYNKAIETDVDIVACDFLFDYGTRQIISSQKFKDEEPYLKQLLMQEIHGSLCNKLIKTELYKKYDIHFPSGIICWEDLYVCCILAHNNCSIEHIPKAFYHYDLISNDSSMSRKVSDKTITGMKFFCDYFESILPTDQQQWLFGAKSSVLVSMYRSRLFSEDEIINAYPSINNHFIQLYKKDYRKVLYSSVAMVLEGRKLNTVRFIERINNYWQKISNKIKL